jgi:hypothetical protein
MNILDLNLFFKNILFHKMVLGINMFASKMVFRVSLSVMAFWEFE